MPQITETDVEVEGAEDKEGVDVQHFDVGEEIEVELGETVAGNIVTTEARYFIAGSQDRETNQMEQEMMGEGERINAAYVHLSNEDGEVGTIFIEVEGATEVDEDGVDAEDAIETFEEQYL